MRWFTFAASFLAVFAFGSIGSLQAHGGGGHGGGHGGGGHGGGGHGGEHAGGVHGGGQHGGGEHGRATFGGGNGNGVNTVLNGLNGGLANGVLANKFTNGQTPLNGGSSAGLSGTNPLAGNPSASIVRLANGGLNNGAGLGGLTNGLNNGAGLNGLTNGLNNGAGLGGLVNGLNPQQLRKLEEQALHKRLIEAHKLAQLAKQTGDPQLLAQAQQMAQQAEQQFAKQFGSLPNGAANHPGIAINPVNQGLNNTTSGGNGFFPPENLAGGNAVNNAAGSSKR